MVACPPAHSSLQERSARVAQKQSEILEKLVAAYARRRYQGKFSAGEWAIIARQARTLRTQAPTRISNERPLVRQGVIGDGNAEAFDIEMVPDPLEGGFERGEVTAGIDGLVRLAGTWDAFDVGLRD